MNKLSKQSTPFTQVPNELLVDPGVSLKAKGLYALMYSKPDGWQFYETALAKECRDGKDAVSSALDELVRAGWLLRSGGREEGSNRFCAYDYELLVSRDGKAVAEKPSRESRDGKPATSNTEPSNTDEVIASVSPQPTKASRRANPGIRLAVFLANSFNSNGAMPVGWEEYPGVELQFSRAVIERCWRTFHRYFTGPDCSKPLKRDWHRAWENWCDREAQNSRGGRGSGGKADGGLTAALRTSVANRYGASQPDGGIGGREAAGTAEPDAGGAGSRLKPGEIPF